MSDSQELLFNIKSLQMVLQISYNAISITCVVYSTVLCHKIIDNASDIFPSHHLSIPHCNVSYHLFFPFSYQGSKRPSLLSQMIQVTSYLSKVLTYMFDTDIYAYSTCKFPLSLILYFDLQ